MLDRKVSDNWLMKVCAVINHPVTVNAIFRSVKSNWIVLETFGIFWAYEINVIHMELKTNEESLLFELAILKVKILGFD